LRGLTAQEQDPRKRVNSITIYEGGYAVKATVFPPVMQKSRDGEPVISRQWLEQVGAVSDSTRRSLKRAGSARLPGDPHRRGGRLGVLGGIVKEDFLRISLWIAVICFSIINLFYHNNRCALRSALAGLVLCGFYPQLVAPGRICRTTPGSMPPSARCSSLAAHCCTGGRARALLLYSGGAGADLSGGIMALLNLLAQAPAGASVDLNFVNVLTIPIILGVGVDNGIHLVNRYFESSRRIRP